METCHDHEISYWPDVGCQMCIAQAEIARLQAEVERWKQVVTDMNNAKDSGFHTIRNEALEDSAVYFEKIWKDEYGKSAARILRTFKT